jgi:hypothetical protein
MIRIGTFGGNIGAAHFVWTSAKRTRSLVEMCITQRAPCNGVRTTSFPRPFKRNDANGSVVSFVAD